MLPTTAFLQIDLQARYPRNALLLSDLFSVLRQRPRLNLPAPKQSDDSPVCLPDPQVRVFRIAALMYVVNWTLLHSGNYDQHEPRELFALACALLGWYRRLYPQGQVAVTEALSGIPDTDIAEVVPLDTKPSEFFWDLGLIVGGEETRCSGLLQTWLTALVQKPLRLLLPSTQLHLRPLTNQVPEHGEIPVDFSKPFIVRKACTWPAMQSWGSLEFLSDQPDRLVPVEIGSTYLDARWTQRLITVRELLNDHWTPMWEGKQVPLAYLAQHPLLDQWPHLQQDVCMPPPCPLSTLRLFWAGPGGTVSPLHTDPLENCFVQVVGTKYMRIMPPSSGDAVRAFSSFFSNTSSVNEDFLDGLRPETSPESFSAEFTAAPFLETYVHPGDLLFFPRGYWHYVKACRGQPICISISHWWEVNT
ncbi:MAG: uncharacterized protein KVP18_003215 [Porospora cf. gigantea A]|uniref:uncharacterized protein n=2 Tax=Porospora cf. gigantea A TaxID=2853593 RepID=UPI0035597CDB|nr:MAG: hypothetical protein KVP18_003215 [Porospora cf. gigantea A]